MGRGSTSVRLALLGVLASMFALHAPINAQYIQNWNWKTYGGVETPYWRPSPRDLLWPVVVFDDGAFFLEYNCYHMKAICQNARAFLLSATGRARRWPNAFTYDLGRRSNARRRRNCPPTWKNTHSCPERAGDGNLAQPPIMPGPWPYTALETIKTHMANEIQADRSTGQEVRSGRMYTCEEFPPASWIEGGGGTPGLNVVPEGDGALGYTRCAPWAIPCGPVKIRSEQNWQGEIHNDLRSILEEKAFEFLGERDLDEREPVVFYFRMSNDPNLPAARVQWVPADGTNEMNEATVPGRRRSVSSIAKSTSIKEILDWGNSLDLADPRVPVETLVELIVLNNTETVRRVLGTPAIFPLSSPFTSVINSTLAENDFAGLNITTHTTRVAASRWLLESSSDSSSLSASEVRPWNLTAANLDTFLVRSEIQTPRQLSESGMDILALGESYIMGNVESNVSFGLNETRGASLSMRERRRNTPGGPLGDGFSPSILSEDGNGPVQCGTNQPCQDGSCCNSDGKCGFKDAHCGVRCISNCDAKAMCGIDSADRKTPCSLKLCCSYYGWCGTEDVHCHDPEPRYGKTPCQIGYGACAKTPSPSCGKSSGVASRRRIGYYQGWNMRQRGCDKVLPRRINTRGFTHLFFAFAFFHPTTFQIMTMHQDDVNLYGEFTSLKRNGLQTWIAIGGWTFNDPGPTQKAFSDMVSTAANRAAFTSSLIEFMDTYGFQGADLDWEYPMNATRGGQPADVDNLVLLVKEMKTAFGGKYGLSLTLAPDYWYLRGFKPAELQQYVDFMGFMAYDLHGPWDTDVKTLGSLVRPHTDITEIDKNLKPLWFDGVDPSKINMGLAYYGRTYKLADRSCGKMGCPFVPKQGGSPGACTNFPGILSNKEIHSILASGGITPYLNETAMVKYFTYDKDSWVGYDDKETFAMKEAFANDRCLGGTMIWSVDFDAETGGGKPGNTHRSPESATVIPMSHTTVPKGATLTVDASVATDIVRLPYNGDQNAPRGPGALSCPRCSFFRLITSTCCGSGGSIGNPVVLPADVPVPMDIGLPAGFVPNQPFVSTEGTNIPPNQPLPKDTTIPKGTIFKSPFIIPPAVSLQEGEGDDIGNDSQVWISPEIWRDPNPIVQCFPPCTLVLPPWPSVTSTIDYPRITMTISGVITTITHRPITITEWDLMTVIVSGTPSSTSTTTSILPPLFTIDPKLSTTTTWPPITTIIGSTWGTIVPTWPPHPPPPLLKPEPPKITVKVGPPHPVVKPCSFPFKDCPEPDPKPRPKPPRGPGPRPRPPPRPPPPNYKPVPRGRGNEPEEETSEEEIQFCAIMASIPSGPNSVSGSAPQPTQSSPSTPRPTSSSPPPPPPPPPKNHPDPSTNSVGCYGSGQWTRRSAMIESINYFCFSMAGQGLLGGRKYIQGTYWADWSASDAVNVFILNSLEVKQGCEWQFNMDECVRYMKVTVDSCNCKGTKHKQGGVLENNCLKWRMDPTGYV